MSDRPAGPGSGFRMDVLGIALMVVGVILGISTGFLVPDPDACQALSVWAAPTLALSVLAFGFGFARCLPDRLRRGVTIAMVILIPFAVVLSIAAIIARPEIRPGDCI
ncbi:MAG: hypothetical protein ACXWW5_03115 [Actinomycetota bacterium]